MEVGIGVNMKILVTIGDNSNKEYSRKDVVDIDPVEYLVYKDCMNYCSSDTYNDAWEHIVRAISQQIDNLPYDWYVDKIEEFWG